MRSLQQQPEEVKTDGPEASFNSTQCVKWLEDELQLKGVDRL